MKRKNRKPMSTHLKQEKNLDVMFWVFLALTAVAAGVFICFCTSISPWGFSDSATYFSTARNFAAGRGFGTYNADGSFTRLTVFAPLFSFVLSGFARLGIDLVQAARWMDVIFFSTLVFLYGWITWRVTNSRLCGFLLALLTGMTPALAKDYTSMMSEPLGILMGSCAILLAALAIKRKSIWLLFISAILADLAVFTRYALVAVPIAGTLIFFFMWPTSWKDRFRKAVVYALPAFVPMVIWLIPEFLAKASLGNRHIKTAIDFAERIKSLLAYFFKVVKYWLPYRTDMIPGLSADVFSPILLGLFAILIAAGLVLALQKGAKETPASLLLLSAFIFLCSYFLVLAFAFIFTASVDINERMLSPMVPFLYILLMTSALLVGNFLKSNPISVILCLIVTGFFLVFNFIPMRTYAIYSSGYPEGYNSPAWQERLIFTEVESLPESVPLLSNAPDVLLFHTNRSAYRLMSEGESRGTNVSADDPETLERLMRQQCGVIVLFKNSDADAYQGYDDGLTEGQFIEMTEKYQSIYSNSGDILLIDKDCSDTLRR
jgi:hypothetical protein